MYISSTTQLNTKTFQRNKNIISLCATKPRSRYNFYHI